MLADTGKAISGFLFEWPARSVRRTDLLECEGMRFKRSIGRTSWELYMYESSVPLRGEDDMNGGGVFNYNIICRRSGPRLLVLSTGREVVEHLLEKVFHVVFLPNLRFVHIAVDSLVKTITAHPQDYVLSFAHARVPAYGANLRSVSFYGDDLANANFFTERIALMTFFTCGLRLVVGGSEIIRLGAEGSVSFIPTDTKRILEVERALHFLRNEGYLDEPDVKGFERGGSDGPDRNGKAF